MTHDASGPVELSSDQAHVLYQKSNLFYVGQLQYVLVFSEFSKVQYLNFAERRNKLMQSCGMKVPHAGLLAVWQPQVVKRGPVVSFGNVGSGKFGWITCAVHSRTGEPLAIKEQRPRDLHDLEKIEFEVRVGKLANVSGDPNIERNSNTLTSSVVSRTTTDPQRVVRASV